jgi:hypothetical protein
MSVLNLLVDVVDRLEQILKESENIVRCVEIAESESSLCLRPTTFVEKIL